MLQVRVPAAAGADEVASGGLPHRGRTKLLRVHQSDARHAAGIQGLLHRQQEVPQTHEEYGTGESRRDIPDVPCRFIFLN